MNVKHYEKCCYILNHLIKNFNNEEEDIAVIQWRQEHISDKNLTFDRFQFGEKEYRKIANFNNKWTNTNDRKFSIVNKIFPKQEYGYWIGLLISSRFEPKVRHVNAAFIEAIKEIKEIREEMNDLKFKNKELLEKNEKI